MWKLIEMLKHKEFPSLDLYLTFSVLHHSQSRMVSLRHRLRIDLFLCTNLMSNEIRKDILSFRLYLKKLYPDFRFSTIDQAINEIVSQGPCDFQSSVPVTKRSAITDRHDFRAIQ